MTLSFVADESVDRQIVERLRDRGFDVLYVAEMAPGTSDDVILAEANRRHAVLVTADKDFGELVFRQRALSSGVVLVRLAGLAPDTKAAMVAAIVEGHGKELLHRFAVISPGSLRIRAQDFSDD